SRAGMAVTLPAFIPARPSPTMFNSGTRRRKGTGFIGFTPRSGRTSPGPSHPDYRRLSLRERASFRGAKGDFQGTITMNANGKPEGNGKLTWWLIGGIITPIALTALNTVSGDSKRVSAIEAIVRQVDRRLERLESK